MHRDRTGKLASNPLCSIVVILRTALYAGGVSTARLPALIPLTCPVMHYDWGSHTLLAAMRGMPRTELPEAELWVGAHPKAPSLAQLSCGSRPLDALLRDHGSEILGGDGSGDGERRLPFLLKLLAVESPLSIQVHTDARAAEAGWQLEQGLGLDAADPRRSFVDRFAKPELFTAITASVVLCGFRGREQVLANLRAVGLDAFAAPLGKATAGELFLHWLETASPAEISLAASVAPSRLSERSDAPLINRLQALHPGDAAVLAPLFMHAVRLDPGDALAVPPGTVHAAISGFGVEIMGASDNVVRAGLTTKHRSLTAFRQLADLTTRKPAVFRAEPDGHGWLRFPTDNDEFELRSARIDGEARRAPGFAVLLCTDGRLHLEAGDSALDLTPGTASLVRAGCVATVSGQGSLFSANIPSAR